MKKILSLIMTIILSLMCFSACTNNETGSRMKEPEFVEREWSGIEWEKIEFPVDEKKVEIPSSIKAIVPCFNSPAAKPSHWIYEISFNLRLASIAT